MDAPVRYVRSRDGTRIAYSVAGDGPVLAHLQVPTCSHIELFPQVPGGRDYLAGLGRGRRLIRIDFRGTGMSEREYEDHSPGALTDDLEAVLDDLGVEQLDLSAGGARVTPALGLAIRRPAAVSRIVLGYPYNVSPALSGRVEHPAMLALMESDWDHYLEVSTQRNTGRRVSDNAEIVTFVRRCFDQRNFVATLKASRPWDDWEAAAHIDIPVLVLEFPGNVHIPAGRVEAFAKRFARGRYMALPERALPPPYGDAELYLQALHEFLGPPPEPAPVGESLLTFREGEVLRLLAAGKTQPEIAACLVISPATVSRHVVSVYAKIGAHRRAEAVTWAIHHGYG